MPLERGRYQGRGVKCNLIFFHLSATPLDDTVNSGTLHLHLNLNSLLWHQPIYHYVINLSVILASRCILLLPFGADIPPEAGRSFRFVKICYDRIMIR